MKESHERFTFTNQLMETAKLISAKDPLTIDLEVHDPVVETDKIKGTIKDLKCKISRLFETRDYLIFALANYQNRLGSSVVIYYFGKGKGENQSKQIPTIKGKVASMEFVPPKFSKKHEVNLNAEGLLLLIGNSEGFLKILDLGQKPQLISIQIDTKPIVDIKVPPAEKFCDTKVCFALAEDYSVFIVNLEREAVIAHFRPTLMMCDVGLCLSLHHSMRYFIQSTKGGYIVLWKINENIFKNLEKDKTNFAQSSAMIDEEEQQKKSKKPPQKIYNIFPASICHSASISGLKFIQFIGDLIALITEEGIFKIIALNIEEKQQFAILLQYPIKNGQTITSAAIFPKQECLIVSKRAENSRGCILECIFYSPELSVTNLLQVEVLGLDQIYSFILNKNQKFLFARDDQKFFITYHLVFSNKIEANKNQNKIFRSLNY